MKQLWLDSRWRSSLGSVKGFIRTHNRWITVLGAAIVFAMFVVKDAYLEHLKEIVGSISQAQSLFVTMNSLKEVDQRLAKIEEAVGVGKETNSKTANKRKKAKTQEGIDTDDLLQPYFVSIRKELLEEGKVEIENLKRLSEAVPGNKDREGLEEVEHSLDDERWDSENGTKPIEIVPPQMEDMENSFNPMGTLKGEVGQILNISFSLEAVHENLLREAETERSRRERRVHQSTVVSYVLYPLGWIIGLLGKLYGEGEVPEA